MPFNLRVYGAPKLIQLKKTCDIPSKGVRSFQVGGRPYIFSWRVLVLISSLRFYSSEQNPGLCVGCEFLLSFQSEASLKERQVVKRSWSTAEEISNGHLTEEANAEI